MATAPGAVKPKRGKRSRRMITAQHLTRLDYDDQPQVKQFTQAAWDSIPSVHSHRAGDLNITKMNKGGWVEIGEKSNAKAPPPLKEEKAKRGTGKKVATNLEETIGQAVAVGQTAEVEGPEVTE